MIRDGGVIEAQLPSAAGTLDLEAIEGIGAADPVVHYLVPALENHFDQIGLRLRIAHLGLGDDGPDHLVGEAGYDAGGPEGIGRVHAIESGIGIVRLPLPGLKKLRLDVADGWVVGIFDVHPIA